MAVLRSQAGASPSAQAVGLATAWMPARALGAGAVLAVGAIHLQQYVVLYSSISTTGTLFVLNFAGATAIGHPDAILAGRIFEVAAVVLLGGFLAGRLIDREPGRRW